MVSGACSQGVPGEDEGQGGGGAPSRSLAWPQPPAPVSLVKPARRDSHRSLRPGCTVEYLLPGVLRTFPGRSSSGSPSSALPSLWLYPACVSHGKKLPQQNAAPAIR